MLYHGAPLEGAIVEPAHGPHRGSSRSGFDPEAVLKAIDSHRPTMAHIVPSIFSGMLALDGVIRDRYSTTSLRKVLHAGAACPVDVKRQMINWWGPIFWEAYGATEGSGTIVRF